MSVSSSVNQLTTKRSRVTGS